MENDWKTMKKVIKNVERPLVLSTHTSASEDQNQYSPSDLVLAVGALLYSSLDTAIISGVREVDFDNYLSPLIKNTERSPTILRIIMVGDFDASFYTKLPSSVTGQAKDDLDTELYRGALVPEEYFPLVLDNPTFDDGSNREIRETIISADENENKFYVSYISLKGSGEYFQNVVFR